MGSVERNGDPVHTEPYTEKSGEPQRTGARERDSLFQHSEI